MDQSTTQAAVPTPMARNSAVVTIRRATGQDVAAIADLLVREFRLYPPGQDWLIPLIRLGVQADVQQRLKVQKYVCLVAIDATETIVGTVEIGYRAVLPWQLGPSPYAYLSNLAVRSAMRQQGIAQQLIAASEPIVQRWQTLDLYLHVMAHNFAARQLYLKAGYAIHQISDEWITWLGLQPRLFLHKRLAGPIG